jgi:hypothetical protein
VKEVHEMLYRFHKTATEAETKTWRANFVRRCTTTRTDRTTELGNIMRQAELPFQS